MSYHTHHRPYVYTHEQYVHGTLTKLEREERYPHPHPKHRNIPTNQTNNQSITGHLNAQP